MRKFGLIGYPLSHSFSQKFFTEKFQREGIPDCQYVNFSIPSIDHLTEIIQSDKELAGLNVTIPYKEAVLPYLSWKDPVVSTIQACNCIRITEGKLFGFNTDVIGFEKSLKKKLSADHKRALILGTGGAAKAVKYVLQKEGIEYKIVSRHPTESESADNLLRYEDITESIIRSYLLIINTTPLGMFPHVDQHPPIPYQAITSKHYLFDLIYNPARTVFLQKGESMGAIIENGSDMLVIQAEESWQIWNSTFDEIRNNLLH
ncbi:MAG: shikimate dehydrogenase [Bacteroidetes bacterium]|nr:MAG: shikimate dehydrogenase [Bacteroidota bacterium]